ncbi:thioredoxin family protein [Shouchella shacheensis]|uniref:thioredoxin family protein n=1 Tax=Shouchella shacheensis TaxID=1649580 RepID=UPI000740419A|nr:thioredoxin family protein [Shouchella shacheensis]
MKERTIKELEGFIHEEKSFFLYLFSPFCGTCHQAEKMLQILESAEKSLQIQKLNLQLAPAFAQNEKIESVPCLLYYKQGKVIRRMHAFQSVMHVRDFIHS